MTEAYAKIALLVEDEDAMAKEIADDLTQRGYSVYQTRSAAEAIKIVEHQPVDVVIADRMLPGLDGLSMISALRAKGHRVPALVLSALSSVDDRIQGLKAGGDDYLTKPFVIDELAARLEALLRRPADLRETVIRAGALELDLISRTANRAGRTIELLPMEFKLLAYLMRRPGLTLTRAMLLEDVWGYRFVPQTNLVDVHIGKLRRKIDGPNEASMISNIHGVGFVLRTGD